MVSSDAERSKRFRFRDWWQTILGTKLSSPLTYKWGGYARATFATPPECGSEAGCLAELLHIVSEMQMKVKIRAFIGRVFPSVKSAHTRFFYALK